LARAGELVVTVLTSMATSAVAVVFMVVSTNSLSWRAQTCSLWAVR
jgi:hypothetical protein